NALDGAPPDRGSERRHARCRASIFATVPQLRQGLALCGGFGRRRGLLFRIDDYHLDAANDGLPVGLVRDGREEHLDKLLAKRPRVRARNLAQIRHSPNVVEGLHDGRLDVGIQLAGHTLLAAGTEPSAAALAATAMRPAS